MVTNFVLLFRFCLYQQIFKSALVLFIL